jgi:hypothetical protein
MSQTSTFAFEPRCILKGTGFSPQIKSPIEAGPQGLRSNCTSHLQFTSASGGMMGVSRFKDYKRIRRICFLRARGMSWVLIPFAVSFVGD